MANLSRMFRRLATDTGGTEIAEAAAILPLLFMIIFGIFWFGQAFRTYGTITRAAQEGARAGAAPYCSSCTGANTPGQNAVNAAQAILVASNLDPAQVKRPSPVPVLNSCSRGGGVACDGAASANFCVQNAVQLSSTVTGAGVCGMSLSFRYPFRFRLPFTSLDNQTVWLTAQARVRLETR